MSFYSTIAKDIPWEITSNTDGYLKVVNGKLQLPSPKWLQYHLRYLDSVIEAIHAFRAGKLAQKEYNLEKVITDVIFQADTAISILKQLSSDYKVFAIDIESDNLLTNKSKNKLLCFGIGYAEDAGVSFTYHCFRNSEFREEFQKFLSNPRHTFILHNGIFDKSRLALLEALDIRIDEDTLLMHYAGINEHKGTHGLKDLAQLYLGFPDWEHDLDEWKRHYCKTNKVLLRDFKYSLFPLSTLAEYNIFDCVATFQLYNTFKQLMRKESLSIYRALIEASEYYSDMVVRGMKIDVEYWYQLKRQLEEQKERLEQELAITMPGVSITSPLQLKKWLTKRFPLEFIESTNIKTIEMLSLKYPEAVELQKIKEHRKNAKYLKTYVLGLWERKDYNNVIHCEYKLHGTETGRLSSANPNMQNIPRSPLIKSLFVSREGYQLLQLDFSQLELRVLAHISGDETLIQCYKDGRDLHSEMQRKIFGKDFDEHDKDQRMAAKIVNFGIPYGRGPSSIAEQLKVSMSVAKKYLADWHAGAPRVSEYIKKCHEMAMAEPQDVWYTVFGRSRHYFITDENIHHTRNQAVNFPITSTANDLTIHSLIEIGKWLKESEKDCYFVNTVHDSIILEVRPEDVQQVSEKCQQIMSELPHRYLVNTQVPFKADVEVGTCWGQLKEPEWLQEEEDQDESDSD